MKLVSLADLKLFMEKTDTDHDKVLEDMLGQISVRIQSFLNRLLEKQARTQYFNGGRRYYYLPAFPIDSIAVLTVVVDSSTQTLDSDYFVWHDEGCIEFYCSVSATQPKNVVITWTGGYDKQSGDVLRVPDDVKRACVLQTAYEFRRRNDLGASSTGMSGGSITYQPPVDFLPDVQSILDMYRSRPTVI